MGPRRQRQQFAGQRLHLSGAGPALTGITSYFAGDMIYCLHEAGSADVIVRHAETAGFPADKVTEIGAIIGPETAEGFMAENS